MLTEYLPNPFADYQRPCDRGQDNVQDLIDAFWEHPYAFSMLAHHRYPEDIIHMFAGRVYKETPLPGLLAMRSINEQGRKNRLAELVAVDRFVESRFGIKIEDTDLMRENFQTLRALIKFIETKHSELHS